MNSIRQEKKIKDVTNRTSIKKKVMSPEEVYRNRRKVVLPSDKDPEYTYGIPTRPPSPFQKVISYHYYREFEKKQEEEKKKELIQKRKLRQEHYERMAAPANLLTNLAANRAQKKDKDPRKLFKMKKFSHAEPKVDSWWTLPPGANTVANVMEHYDSPPRKTSSARHTPSSPSPQQRPMEDSEPQSNVITEEEYHKLAMTQQQDIPEEHQSYCTQEIPEVMDRHPCHCDREEYAQAPEEVEEVHSQCQYREQQQEIPEEYSYEYEQEIPMEE